MRDKVIARWTTPGVTYTPKCAVPADIAEIYMAIKQGGRPVIERNMSTATVTATSFFWRFTQLETSKLLSNKDARLKIDYLTTGGLRYTTELLIYDVDESAKNEVME